MAVANRLSLNVAETEFMIIGCHQRLLVPNDEQINVQINGKAIKRVSETKPCLTWTRHVEIFPKTLRLLFGLLNGFASL